MRRFSTRQVFPFWFLLTLFLLLNLMMPHLMTILCEKSMMNFPKGTLTTQCQELMRLSRVWANLIDLWLFEGWQNTSLEVYHVDLSAFEGECENSFSFFYLSSEDCREAHSIDAYFADGCRWKSKRTSHDAYQKDEWRSGQVNGEDRQEGNQQLDYKENGWTHSWGTWAHRPCQKGQTEKQGYNWRIRIHRATHESGMDNQAWQIQMQTCSTRQSSSRYLQENCHNKPSYRNASMHALVGSFLIRQQGGITRSRLYCWMQSYHLEGSLCRGRLQSFTI